MPKICVLQFKSQVSRWLIIQKESPTNNVKKKLKLHQHDIFAFTKKTVKIYFLNSYSIPMTGLLNIGDIFQEALDDVWLMKYFELVSFQCFYCYCTHLWSLIPAVWWILMAENSVKCSSQWGIMAETVVAIRDLWPVFMLSAYYILNQTVVLEMFAAWKKGFATEEWFGCLATLSSVTQTSTLNL